MSDIDVQMESGSKEKEKEQEFVRNVPDFWGRNPNDIRIGGYTARKSNTALKPPDYQRFYLTARGSVWQKVDFS